MGAASGDSTVWTMVARGALAPEATACGTKPPRTAAAMIADQPDTPPHAHAMQVTGPPKGQVRTPGVQVEGSKNSSWTLTGSPKAARSRGSPTARTATEDRLMRMVALGVQSGSGRQGDPLMVGSGRRRQPLCRATKPTDRRARRPGTNRQLRRFVCLPVFASCAASDSGGTQDSTAPLPGRPGAFSRSPVAYAFWLSRPDLTFTPAQMAAGSQCPGGGSEPGCGIAMPRPDWPGHRNLACPCGHQLQQTRDTPPARSR